MFLAVSDLIAISFGLPVLLLLRGNSFHHDVMATHVEKLVSQNALRVEKSRRKTLSRYQADGISYLFDQGDGESTTKNKGVGSDKVNKTLDRKLEHGTTLAKYTFPECMEQNLTPEECQAMIEQMIDDAGGHEIGDDVKVKIHTPRTPDELSASYWMAEVPTDIYGKVSCNHNNGKVHYPFEWNVKSVDGGDQSSVPVEDVDCLGLTAGECCVQIRNYGRTLTDTGYDANDQCLLCFVHQEPLVPIKNSNGETSYLDCTYLMDNGGECEEVQLNGSEVDGLDQMALERIVSAATSLDNFMTQQRSCVGFDDLLSNLYDAAVHIPPLSIEIGRLSCSICYNGGENDLNSPEVDSLVMGIKHLLDENKSIQPNSKEHCIVIYTNESGDIVLVPKLGGGIADTLSSKGIVPKPAPSFPPEPSPTTMTLMPVSPSLAPVAKTRRPVATTCKTDPDICGEYEQCNIYGICEPFDCGEIQCNRLTEICKSDYGGVNSRCIPGNCQDIPSQCNEETEACKYDSTSSDYICKPATCLEQPSLCNEETEVCDYDRSIRDHACRPPNCEEQPSLCNYESEVCRYDDTAQGYICKLPTCNDEPSQCNEESEVCLYDNELKDYKCFENVCLRDPPPGCLRDDVMCVPTSDNPEGFECRYRHCLYDPTVCTEDEYCYVTEDSYYYDLSYYYDSLYGYEHECLPYNQVGELCGYSEVYPPSDDQYLYYISDFRGKCNPNEAFCFGGTYCLIPADEYPNVERRCIAFGEGSCSDENGNLTQENCKSDEYCVDASEKCRPRLSKDECCSHTDECENGLLCAKLKFLYIDEIFHDYNTCQPSCEVDDDCDEGHWCSPTPVADDRVSASYCKPYVHQGSTCRIFENEDVEERCDPSVGYCYDPASCKKYFYVDRSFRGVPQVCKDYGNACTSTSDCEDPTTEWCDTSVGYCKIRYLEDECCLTSEAENGGQATNDECEGDTVCQLIQPEWFSIEEYYEFYSNEAKVCQ